MVLLAVSFPSLRLPEQGIRSCGGVLTYALSWSLRLLGSLCDRVVNPSCGRGDSARHVLGQRNPTLSDYLFGTLWSTKMLNEIT